MGKRERVRARKLKKKKAAASSSRNRQSQKVIRSNALGTPSGGFNSGCGKKRKRKGKGIERDGKRAGVPFGIARGKEACLVVGDGDFSFSWCLGRLYLKNGLAVKTLLCTSYDSAEDVLDKYGKIGEECIEHLKGSDVRVMHNVDATCLQRSAAASERFDHIIFNFPHSGAQRVHENRALLRHFF